jgi:hypothetical protein
MRQCGFRGSTTLIWALKTVKACDVKEGSHFPDALRAGWPSKMGSYRIAPGKA